MYGVSSGRISSGSKNPGEVKKPTFFGVSNNRQQNNISQLRHSSALVDKNGKRRLCKVCNGSRGVWAFGGFQHMDVTQRWNVAK